MAGTPDPGQGSQPCFRVLDGFWVTTLRTSSASVIASPLGPVHLAAVARRCRENVEAANVSAQLLRHPRLTVCGLRQWPVGSKSCGAMRHTLFWLTAKRECGKQHDDRCPRAVDAEYRWRISRRCRTASVEKSENQAPTVTVGTESDSPTRWFRCNRRAAADRQ